VWFITFTSLQYAVISPDVLHITDVSAVLGPNVVPSIKRVATSASLPLLRLVAASNVTSFQLTINGSNIQGSPVFSYASSAVDIQQALAKSIGYVRVEKVERTATIREWLILSYPVLMVNMTTSSSMFIGGSLLSVVKANILSVVHVESVQQTGMIDNL
jgi:hypothetical protein